MVEPHRWLGLTATTMTRWDEATMILFDDLHRAHRLFVSIGAAVAACAQEWMTVESEPWIER
jgi:hypothetical protein